MNRAKSPYSKLYRKNPFQELILKHLKAIQCYVDPNGIPESKDSNFNEKRYKRFSISTILPSRASVVGRIIRTRHEKEIKPCWNSNCDVQFKRRILDS
ncbi:hypothetical protein TNIN_345641 [Trichonephila inaurata madagascariensis]|uniref:Uncharacterized protein n=1 Tax=Trichonephila inaurata madagascariensis TaxID=2747483 RepID=A0A8X6JJ48_9ARAC|nr:hypothetical protein TNIN_345641 [Trichonephila inaurata madagascariensis]